MGFIVSILLSVLALLWVSFPQPASMISEKKQKVPTYYGGGKPNSYPKAFNFKQKEREVQGLLMEVPYLIETQPLETEPSVIEKLFMNKHPQRKLLKQFGYEIFSVRYIISPFVYVGKDYLLGPGDELVIYFWGDPVDVLGLESFYEAYVDREGKVFIPSVGVVYVWNKTLGWLEKELKKRLSRKFKRFDIEVSVGKLRSFPVYVTGYVNRPGVVMANATNSVIDVLTLAGGVSKNGSLRRIKLRRANGTEIEIDLYKLLIEGKRIDIKVKDGDVIHVPEIGNTVGIAGNVKREAIYELKGERTLKEVISLAGGVLFSAYDRGVRVYRYKKDKLNVLSGDLGDENFAKIDIKDGDLVYIERVKEFVWNKITVTGHVQYPGDYSAEDYPLLSKLIETVGLLPDTNLYYGEIVRYKGGYKEEEVIRFAPLDIIEGKTDHELKPLDRVVFFPKWVYKPIKVSGEIENPKVIPYREGITLKEVLKDSKFTYPLNELKAIIIYDTAEITRLFRNNKHFEDILSSLMSNPNSNAKKEESGKDQKVVSKNGQKSQSVSQGQDKSYTSKDKRLIKEVYLYDLLIRGSKESDLPIFPGTSILIVKIEKEITTKVTILGEVKKPGVYKLTPGMTLYDLIVKAGGFTKRAYPKGLIFIRQSAKRLQEEHLKIALTALEESLLRSEEGVSVAGVSGEEKAIISLAISRQRQLLNLIKQKAKLGLGRIAIDMPERLKDLKNSPENIVLEDGDYIFVPSRPSYVLILGDVYNQVSVPYVKGKTVAYYLQQVGGPAENADLDNIYIIKANGRVISRKNFGRVFDISWEQNKLYFGGDFMDMVLDEGDTIVVPSKLKIPTMWRPLIRDVVQIIFQAMATAVLAQRL